MKLKRSMYNSETAEFYLGNSPQRSRKQSTDGFDFLAQNLYVLEFATAVIVLSAIIVMAQYICDRFRRVSQSNDKDEVVLDCKQAILKKQRLETYGSI